MIYLKGAPERLFGMCTTYRAESLEIPMDRTGLGRTGAIAISRTGNAHPGDGHETSARHTTSTCGLRTSTGGCTLLGLLGIIDPPREEATAAVADCASAGIRVKMITGDHAETARAIGARLGIGQDKPAMTGQSNRTTGRRTAPLGRVGPGRVRPHESGAQAAAGRRPPGLRADRGHDRRRSQTTPRP
jgi:magnesium-transporting ATPase (P-type)